MTHWGCCQSRDSRIAQLLQEKRFTEWLFGGKERLDLLKDWLLTPSEGSFNIGASTAQISAAVLIHARVQC